MNKQIILWLKSFLRLILNFGLQKDYNEYYDFMIMGISIRNFLERYFTSEKLKEPLEDIGLPVGGTKKEKIARIIKNWESHNRYWYDLLNYLKWDKLSLICEDFGILYSPYNTEETLRDKIENNEVLDFRKHILVKDLFFQSEKEDNELKNEKKLHNKKIKPWVILGIVCWIVIGISFAFLNLTGYYIPTHTESIKISKDYLVYFEEWTESGYHGQSTGLTLSGDIIFNSTSFSAKNPINVMIELKPNVFVDDNPNIFQSVPQPLSVFFVGTTIPDPEPDDNDGVTRIFLKQSFNPDRLIASGTIIYSQGGTHEIYLVDPRETGLVSDLLTVNEPPNVIVLSQVPDPPKITERMDNNGKKFPTPSRLDLTSETKPYTFEIKQSDALNSLESEKINNFGIWLGITFGPTGILGIIITLLSRKSSL